MAEQTMRELLTFVNADKVPARVMNSVEGARIKARLAQIKNVMGEDLVRVDLYPNVGHVPFGTGEVLNGVVYHVKRGTPMGKLVGYLGPLYQHLAVVDVRGVEDSKVEKFKDQWKNTIDTPKARGSGLPDFGEDVHGKIDIISMYKSETGAKEWYTSLGTTYPAYAVLTKERSGTRKLILAGGHQQLHNQLMSFFEANADLTVEQVAEKNFTLGSSGAMSLMSKVKDLQKINHSQIAAKVLGALGMRTAIDEPIRGFDSPVELGYSCFYNTIQDAGQTAQNQIFAISQGVVSTTNDFVSLQGNDADLYMFENPRKVHQITIGKGTLGDIRYFPITTGQSEFTSLGMTQEERAKVRDGAIWTGVLNVHHVGNLSYQPYDDVLKTSTNKIFGGNAYAVVKADVPLEAQLFCITGIDARSLQTEDYLKHTEHLQDSTIINSPSNSPAVDLIFKTFPKVLDMLKDRGVTSLELFKVLQTDPQSNHFTQFPLGSLRLADQVSRTPQVKSAPVVLPSQEKLIPK